MRKFDDQYQTCCVRILNHFHILDIFSHLYCVAVENWHLETRNNSLNHFIGVFASLAFLWKICIEHFNLHCKVWCIDSFNIPFPSKFRQKFHVLHSKRNNKKTNAARRLLWRTWAICIFCFKSLRCDVYGFFHFPVENTKVERQNNLNHKEFRKNADPLKSQWRGKKLRKSVIKLRNKANPWANWHQENFIKALKSWKLLPYVNNLATSTSNVSLEVSENKIVFAMNFCYCSTLWRKKSIPFFCCAFFFHFAFVSTVSWL